MSEHEESGFPFSNPFAEPEPDPKATDDTPMEPDPEPAPASMSMTKAELLERVQELEAELTKAKLLDRIHDLEDGGTKPDPTPAAAPMDTATRSATVDGVTMTWTEATEGVVPQAYRDIYAQSKAAGG